MEKRDNLGNAGRQEEDQGKASQFCHWGERAVLVPFHLRELSMEHINRHRLWVEYPEQASTSAKRL